MKRYSLITTLATMLCSSALFAASVKVEGESAPLGLEHISTDGDNVSLFFKSDPVETFTENLTIANFQDAVYTFKTSDIKSIDLGKTATITLKNDEVVENIPELLFYNDKIDATSPATIASSLGLGWNLGNQMDSHNNGYASEDGWGNPIATQELFNRLSELGFTSVRIPITWLGRVDDEKNFEIDPEWLDRVEELVGYAKNANLNAVINIHHDGVKDNKNAYWLNIAKASNDEDYNEFVQTKLAAIWTQIAERFKNYGDFLIFEAMNEIQDGNWGWGANLNDDGKQFGVLNQWNQTFVNAVRAVGGYNLVRYLGIPTYSASCGEPNLLGLKVPNDIVKNRLLISIHYYDPSTYAIEDNFSYWGHTAPADNPLSCTKKNMKVDYDVNESSAQWTMGRIKAIFVDKGYPVYLGEFGSVHRRDSIAEEYRKYYLEYNCRLARDNKLAIFYWDNGSYGYGRETFGILTHDNGEFINNGKDIVDVMVRGYLSNEEGYNLNAIYKNAPIFPKKPDNSAINEVSPINVFATDGKIIVENAENQSVKVIDALGRVIFVGCENNISVEKGVYLVIVGNLNFKVAVF